MSQLLSKTEAAVRVAIKNSQIDKLVNLGWVAQKISDQEVAFYKHIFHPGSLLRRAVYQVCAAPWGSGVYVYPRSEIIFKRSNNPSTPSILHLGDFDALEIPDFSSSEPHAVIGVTQEEMGIKNLVNYLSSSHEYEIKSKIFEASWITQDETKYFTLNKKERSALALTLPQVIIP